MESSSNALPSASARLQDFEYLYASNTNVSNFVSVKLSGHNNYHVWKSQMLCLFGSNNMRSIVDPTFVGPSNTDTDTAGHYDCLARGWILGCVSEDILVVVHDLKTAKDVWVKLQSIYDPPISPQEETLKKIEEDEGTNSLEIIVDEDIGLEQKKKTLRAATIKGDWSEAEPILKEVEGLATKAISGDGSTILHIAVGIGHNDFVKNLFFYLDEDHVLQRRESDGSTALHIAAIVGNTDATDLLVVKNKKLLRIKDCNGAEPLNKAYENMHLDTIGYLLKAVKENDATSHPDTIRYPSDERATELLVHAISAKQYSLALEFVHKFSKSASKSDDVLMAIAKNFPTGLDYSERLVYPRPLGSILEIMIEQAINILLIFLFLILSPWDAELRKDIAVAVPLLLLGLVFSVIYLLILIVYFPFLLLYSIWWKGARIIVPPIKHIDIKKKEWDEAKNLLRVVCDEIDKDKLNYPRTHHPCYTRPILEAACQNAFKVVDEILFRSPEAIQSTDKNGYDIIQLAIINRSEKIYNLIYDIGERKNQYRTYNDSSGNNILHLAGKLAPLSVLNQRTGAALQLQRELQWREEVKKFVFPTYITRENIFKETPDMVFTREHKDLVKQGEQWIKTTAESCSITAALITTIVFAAAITVPGGSHQENGTPLFKKRASFIIFAVSDAISLFASSTALLVFLSILTARFAERDFLLSLPRRLFIGLFSLLLSTTTMMVAFSATVFLVFGDEKRWMLAPICGLAFIPIAFFVGLQFPLMVDLFSSTYIRIFGKQRKSVFRRFNKDEIRLIFGNKHAASIREKKRNGKQDNQLVRVITKGITRLRMNSNK